MFVTHHHVSTGRSRVRRSSLFIAVMLVVGSLFVGTGQQAHAAATPVPTASPNEAVLQEVTAPICYYTFQLSGYQACYAHDGLDWYVLWPYGYGYGKCYENRYDNNYGWMGWKYLDNWLVCK